MKNGAGSHRLRDFAPNDPLGFGRILHLVADGDPLPSATSRPRYSSKAFAGTPARGTRAATPLFRDVSVNPRSRDPSSASPKKSS